MLLEELRTAVVQVGKELAASGLVLGTWGNVSAREGDLVAITPSGLPYSALAPEDIVVVDLEGETVEGKWRPSTELPLHLAVYRKRPDVGGIVHTHSVGSMTLAACHHPLPPFTEEQAQLIGGRVPVAAYAPPGTEELAQAAVAALGEGKAVLLANHGLVGVGKTVEEALLTCQVVEKSAQIYLWACLLGGPVLLSEEEVRSLRENFLRNYGQKGAGG
ncbi:class II aldolase/adducin family protein [Ammonifex degensii KC4]|uniref:Class II aldolase/adducin family protein n=1 Tax=Ammonifex degensii (strain DSM 10501 / KC4) TaxID=429009 RepID=C9RCX4_AMMDK|nr:class II aldolase/adducin family protein [Ammonifex degensii]ACX52101.1 class II aldolase/adducin family protein [Ammonifex degensii KC4]